MSILACEGMGTRNACSMEYFSSTIKGNARTWYDFKQ
ncbi:uncharacterized protein J3R85_011552 [Psidium guajava]|nr:uncharacterized protein J3R85_011552 [Psidium guajava]